MWYNDNGRIAEIFFRASMNNGRMKDLSFFLSFCCDNGHKSLINFQQKLIGGSFLSRFGFLFKKITFAVSLWIDYLCCWWPWLGLLLALGTTSPVWALWRVHSLCKSCDLYLLLIVLIFLYFACHPYLKLHLMLVRLSVFCMF